MNEIEQQIQKAYGEQYVNLFLELQESEKPYAREKATETGKRAVSYLVRSEAFDVLDTFLRYLVNQTRHPQLLQTMVKELENISEHPSTEKHWQYVNIYLADALHNLGQSEQSLPIYAQAVAEAEMRQDQEDIGLICHNRAYALRNVGQLDKAYENFLRSLEISRNTGSTELDIIATELEVLRLEIMRGQVQPQQVLPQIEQRLIQLQNLWQHDEKEALTSSPFGTERLARLLSLLEAEKLTRTLLGALDIAQETHRLLEHWQDCLDLLSEQEKLQKARGESEHDLAITRFNRYGVLLMLEQVKEAKQVLENCLHIFKKAGDTTRQVQTLSALAHVWYKQGDLEHAIELERQSLGMDVINPEDRALSHGNLANCLNQNNKIKEGAFHRLAQMVYYIVTDNQQRLFAPECLGNLVKIIQIFAKYSTPYPLPCLNDLLDNSEFRALRHFLEEHNINLDELQEKIDELLKQVEQQLLEIQ